MVSSTLQARLSDAIRAIRDRIRNGAPEWVSDNYYLIDRQFNAACRCARVRSQRSHTQKAESLAAAYLAEVSWKPDIDSLTAFLRERARDTEISHPTLCALPAMLSANAILRIGGICKGQKDASLLPDAIGVLRFATEPSQSELFTAAWKPEQVLLRAEPTYSQYSAATRASYRRALAEQASRQHRTEYAQALFLEAEAGKRRVPIGQLLFPQKAFEKAALLWWGLFSLLFAASVVLCAHAFGWVTVFLTLPLAEGIAPLCDRLVARFRTEHAPLRLELQAVPQEARTVIAVTTLLQPNSDAWERLERFYYLNREDNLYFCLLADYPESEKQTLPTDKELLSPFVARMEELNREHGERFFLLCRERTPNGDGKFGGRERKRGAVCTLIRRLCGEQIGILYGSCPENVRYLLTLDADTELSPGLVKQLLGVALHPVNRGYGVFQPAVQTELFSSYKTYFTRLISGSAGSSFYERAAFDRNQSLYGEGIFCGKGLLDVQKFRAHAMALPDGCILSHDLPEGGLLRTRLLSDLPVSDSVPSTPAAWDKRAHRWIRGDVQNLYFLFHPQYALSPVSKRQIVGNLLRHLTPVFCLLALLCGAFTLQTETRAGLLVLAAHTHLLLPFLAGSLAELAFGDPFLLRHAFTAGLSAGAERILRLGYDLCAGARNAFLSLDAFARSLWRMAVSRKKLLEWTTAAAGETGANSLAAYLQRGLPSGVTGTLLFLFGRASVYRLLGIVFFAYPLIAYLLSKPLTRGGAEYTPTVSEKDAAVLKRHAADQWRFFADTVTRETHFLPPDNLQLSPRRDLAMRTSPTNIGLFLLSVTAALDLGFLDAKEAADRLERTLATVEGLPKYHGNLYNWYDLQTLAVAGDGFVSFVDSGNLTVCLLTLEQTLLAYGDAEERFPALASQARRLADETELSVFYTERKALFSLGVDGSGKKEAGCYDLLMSEARTAGYYAIAAGLVPKKHWDALGRTVSSENGYIGMVSWSGTMFEYFMPQLFLPIYRNSFLQETLLFAVSAQRRAAKGKPWGVSESGYYAFDGELHYRYRAHGVRALALRRDVCGDTVISPYASYLALAVCPNAVMRNLRALENSGMYGEYGMYEAFDRTPGRSRDGIAVRSYMAHHVGMSLLAIDNAVNGSIFVKRFLSDKRMRAAVGLLQEKLPQDLSRLTQDLQAPPRSLRLPRAEHRAESFETDLSRPRAALLCKDGFSASITSLGHIRLQKGELLLNDCRVDRFSCAHTLTVAFPEEERVNGCTPFFGEGAYAFESDTSSVCLIAGSKRFSGRVRFSFCRRADCFRVETQAESRKSRSVLFALEPMLSDLPSHDAHSAFSKLFIQSEYEASTGILFFFRRERQTGKACHWLAVALQDEKTHFTFCTDKGGFAPESLNGPDAFAVPTDNRTGICIDPLCVIRTSPCPGGRATLLLSAGRTQREARAAILTARHEKEISRAGADPYTNSLLTELLFPHSPAPGTWDHYQRDMLWKYGISGDFPLLGLCVGESDRTEAKRMLAAFAELTRAGIRTELLLLPVGDGQYFRPVEKKLLALCEEAELQGMLGVRGGILLLRREQLEQPFPALLAKLCTVWRDPARLGTERTPLPFPVFTPPETTPTDFARQRPDNALAVCGGYATEDGFTVCKQTPFPAVRSYVLAGRRCGSIVTASSLGYTFCGNAHERRLTPFFGDPGSLSDGERLYLRADGVLYDLVACAGSAFFGKGCALWEGRIGQVTYSVIGFCSADKPLKTVRVLFSTPIGELFYAIRPVMGSGVLPERFLRKKECCGAVLFRSGQDMAYADGVGLLYAKGGRPVWSRAELFGGTDDGFYDLICIRASGNYVNFFLGELPCTEEELPAYLHGLSAEEEQAGAERFAAEMLPPIRVQTNSKAQDLFFGSFLPYQIAACRYYARASFRQSGGAYGFRDQLQDCLALVYADSAQVREHILRCCAHQYEEGDVQHWWHEGGRGIRTTCSDDLLWLPYVVADYVNKTGDSRLLFEQAEYLSSPPLNGENERYELPERSFLSETVLLHCLRAFAKADTRGRHGLLLMGCCDWNDAFSAVGAKGIGESVFSTLLYVVAANAFLPLLEQHRPEDALQLRRTAEQLLQAVETHAFAGDRYLRAFADGGEVLGQAGAKECAMDILSQAFALFAGADRSRCETALDTAERLLYDPVHRILKLFTPPFGQGTLRAGYIRGYPPGIRENGGQYTHAAVWGAMAFLRVGKTDTALDLLAGCNPLLRTANAQLASQYRSEPYALCADIYAGEHAGRGGWSWYTGSAAWYYKVFLEEVLGIRLRADGRIIEVYPRIPYEATLRYHGTVRIRVAADTETCLDGCPVTFPVSLSDGAHLLTVRLP